MLYFLFVSFPRECFPCSLQFSIVTRFCIDQTQSPNLKVKFVIFFNSYYSDFYFNSYYLTITGYTKLDTILEMAVFRKRIV